MIYIQYFNYMHECFTMMMPFLNSSELKKSSEHHCPLLAKIKGNTTSSQQVSELLLLLLYGNAGIHTDIYSPIIIVLGVNHPVMFTLIQCDVSLLLLLYNLRLQSVLHAHDNFTKRCATTS